MLIDSAGIASGTNDETTLEISHEPIRRPALPPVRLEQTQPRQPRRDGADDPADVARRHSRPGGRGLLPAARRKRHRPDHTEGTVVDDPVSTMSCDIPNFYGPALDGWLRVVDAVHEVGGKIMPQLWHFGMARNPAKAPSSGAAERRPVGPDHARLPGPDPARPPAFGADDARAYPPRRRGLRSGRRGRAAPGIRRRRDPRRPWLPDRPVLLGRHQSARRRIWRRPGRPHPLRSRDHRGGAPRDRAGFPDHPALLAMEAAGLRGAARDDPGGARPFPGAAIDRRRRYLPLLPASLLGAGIRGLRPEPRRLDQEAYRQTHRHRRQRRAVRRRHRLVARRIFQGHRDPRPARPAGARRVRSGRGRSRAAGRPGLGAPAAGGPLQRAADLLARGARDTVLTPRALSRGESLVRGSGPWEQIQPYT